MKHISKTLTILIAFILLLGEVSGYKTVYSGKECQDCLNHDKSIKAVCRSQFSQKTSYCCTDDDLKNNAACRDSNLCSD